MAMYVNNGGQKKVKSIWINNGGAKKVKTAWTNVNGIAKKTFTNELVLNENGVDFYELILKVRSGNQSVSYFGGYNKQDGISILNSGGFLREGEDGASGYEYVSITYRVGALLSEYKKVNIKLRTDVNYENRDFKKFKFGLTNVVGYSPYIPPTHGLEIKISEETTQTKTYVFDYSNVQDVGLLNLAICVQGAYNNNSMLFIEKIWLE